METNLNCKENSYLYTCIWDIFLMHFSLVYYFRCMVKITGNVMMSFPAGVVRVFTENPSPALLSFKIKNTSRLEQVLLNQQLIIQ